MIALVTGHASDIMAALYYKTHQIQEKLRAPLPSMANVIMVRHLLLNVPKR